VRGTRAVLVLFCLSFLATGCATRASVNRARADIATLARQLDELRQAQDQLALQLARMASDLRQSQARLQTLGPDVAQSTEAVHKLNVRIDATEATVARLQTTVERVAEREPAPPPVPAPAPTAASPPVPDADRVHPAEPPARDDQVTRVYTAALDLYRAREYGQAVLDFLDFVARYPKNPLANNAQYWIGEAYFGQRDYRQAALEFQRVLENDPRGRKVPDAILKLGLCYVSLHQPGRAHELWRQVVREYPDSESARKARSFLRAGDASLPLSR